MKKLLLITMLLGVGYSNDCSEYNEQNGTLYNCECNESTWEEYHYPDMWRCWLDQVDFSNLDLSDVNLGEAYLYMANFTGTDLHEANLVLAWASQSNFQGADLSGADLWGANLAETNLVGANLAGASLYGITISGANLEGTNLCNLMGSPNAEVCEQHFLDENGDGYDDVSYDAGATSADPCYGVVCDDDPEMICICGECTYEDEQGDTGGGDCSYGDECFEAGAESGDLNLDGTDNVLDVVILVDNILNP